MIRIRNLEMDLCRRFLNLSFVLAFISYSPTDHQEVRGLRLVFYIG